MLRRTCKCLLVTQTFGRRAAGRAASSTRKEAVATDSARRRLGTDCGDWVVVHVEQRDYFSTLSRRDTEWTSKTISRLEACTHRFRCYTGSLSCSYPLSPFCDAHDFSDHQAYRHKSSGVRWIGRAGHWHGDEKLSFVGSCAVLHLRGPL